MINYIKRYLDIERMTSQGKVLLILGPRRTGKSTILANYLATTHYKYLSVQGDTAKAQIMLNTNDVDKLRSFISGYELLVIDEAQAITNIGLTLKLLVDNFPDLRIIVTGSSAFELAGQLGEPLTGRKVTKYLLPFSFSELDLSGRNVELNDCLIFGSYPDVVNNDNHDSKIEFLSSLKDEYLLKDILQYQEIKGPDVILRLLSLIAYQIGSEVSLNELGDTLGIDKKTVARYLDLMEKTFIIFRLGGYSRNLRNEVNKKAKYYFYDNGVRNAVINNFNSLEYREDVGKLWENYIISERLKHRRYSNILANQYFWRTWNGQEIDLVEEREGKLLGYEIKWNTKKTVKVPKDWQSTYPDQAEWLLISPENYKTFLSN